MPKCTMSRVENNVVSLKLAKKLKEAGVEQESMLFWVRWEDKDKWSVKCPDEYMRKEWESSPLVECYSAYTVTELMEELPSLVKQEGEHFALCVYKESNNYIVQYEGWRCDEIETLCKFENRKLVDACAQALIWVKKNV